MVSGAYNSNLRLEFSSIKNVPFVHTVCIKDLDKPVMFWWFYFRLEQLFTTAPTASKYITFLKITHFFDRVNFKPMIHSVILRALLLNNNNKNKECRFWLNYYDFTIICTKSKKICYRAFHGLGQAKFAYGGSVLGLNQFTLLPKMPLKMMLDLKAVKIDSKIIISLP